MRLFSGTGARLQPCSVTSGPVTHNGLKYVVLRNTNGVLAVYRIRPNGALKGLKRYPKALLNE